MSEISGLAGFRIKGGHLDILVVSDETLDTRMHFEASYFIRIAEEGIRSTHAIADERIRLDHEFSVGKCFLDLTPGVLRCFGLTRLLLCAGIVAIKYDVAFTEGVALVWEFGSELVQSLVKQRAHLLDELIDAVDLV